MTDDLTYQRLQDEIIDGLSHRIAGGMDREHWESWFMCQRADGSIWDAMRGNGRAAQWSLPESETMLLWLEANVFGSGHEFQRIDRVALNGWIEGQQAIAAVESLLAVAR